MTIDNEDNIHIIINKKGYGKTFDEERKETKRIEENLINAILDELNTYSICVDNRVSGIEVLNAIKNIIYNYKYK